MMRFKNLSSKRATLFGMAAILGLTSLFLSACLPEECYTEESWLVEPSEGDVFCSETDVSHVEIRGNNEVGVGCEYIGEIEEEGECAGAEWICFSYTITNISATCVEDDSVPPSIWLSDVCQPYDGGMFDEYGQITVGTDSGTTLYVGASVDGPWTELTVNGPPWVLLRADLEVIAANLGVESIDDLWFSAAGSGRMSQAQRLGSMVTDRVARWEAAESCTPVEGGPE